MIEQFAFRQFVYFLIVGGLAATINFISRILFSQHVSFSIAVILAYFIGMVCAFVMSRYLVFGKGEHPLHRSVIYFIVVNIFGVLQTWLISMALLAYVLPMIGIDGPSAELISHAFGILAPVFTSYLEHKHFSFA